MTLPKLRTRPSFDAVRADYLAHTNRAYTAEQFDNAVSALVAFAVTQGTRHDEQCETRWVNGEYTDCGCTKRNTIKGEP
ncbi:hypothetical protein AB0300_18815 [Microbacterium sp. NPDC078814]|uniref:hypothetical protein n=1 Tax=Microbacterium sp. NPDC078814 TaxID=3154767 RepID=UPI00344E9120